MKFGKDWEVLKRSLKPVRLRVVIPFPFRFPDPGSIAFPNSISDPTPDSEPDRGLTGRGRIEDNSSMRGVREISCSLYSGIPRRSPMWSVWRDWRRPEDESEVVDGDESRWVRIDRRRRADSSGFMNFKVSVSSLLSGFTPVSTSARNGVSNSAFRELGSAPPAWRDKVCRFGERER